jgi:glucuronosyltransferase
MIRAVTVIVAFAILGAVPVENVRVLAVETRGGKSHWNFMSGLLRSLTDAGHEVVAFTPFPDGPRANYTEIDTSGQVKVHVGVTAERVLKDFALMSTNVAIIRHNCDGILRHRRFEGILRDHDTGTAKFDVVIADPSAADCVSHVAHTLNLPVVYSISSSMLTFAERRFTGHASNPACISNLIAHHSVPRTFVQRLTNTFTTVYSTAAYEYENWLQRITDPKPYDSSPSVPPSVIFQNSYYGTEAPRPVPTNLIDVGGIHLKPAGKIPKVS